MKLKLPENINDKIFMSKKAGSFSGVPQSTVQAWTDKGYVISTETGGTGDRRKYSALDCVEIGIVKKMSDDRVSYKIIGRVMDTLRGETQNWLDSEYVYIIIRESKLDIPNVTILSIVPIKGRIATDQKTLEKWYAETAQTGFEKVLIYDFTKIAARVLRKVSQGG